LTEQALFDSLAEQFAEIDALEGAVWIEDQGTTHVSETGAFGFYVTAFDDGGEKVWRLGKPPIQGIPIVRKLNELVDAGRARLLETNCGYPLVYSVRACDVPDATLAGDDWLRVEAFDAS
jgi:hypothetical protein